MLFSARVFPLIHLFFLLGLLMIPFSDLHAGKEDFDWGGEKMGSKGGGGKGSMDDGLSSKDDFFDPPKKRERRRERPRRQPKVKKKTPRVPERPSHVRESVGAAYEGTDGLTWGYIKDQTAEGAINYVKDSMGRFYKLVPGGPKLPFGISKKTIESQAKRYGWKMLPIPNKAAEKLGKRLSGGWEVFKLGQEVYDAYTGEDSVKTAQNKIIASTVAAEAGLGMGYAISLVPGAGVGPVMLAGWAGNNVKTAVLEGLEAWDAHVQAMEDEKAWKANDLRLARQKVKQIRDAIKRNDFKKAIKLNQGLNSFTDKRELGTGDMSRLNEMTWSLQRKIYAAAREAKAQERQDEAARQAEYQAKLDRIRAFWEEEARRKEAKEQIFAVRLIPSATNVAAGEEVTVGLLLLRGVPPFKVSGSITESTRHRELEFSFKAPKEPGVHELEVTARDAAGNVRDHSVDILVATKQAKKKKKKGPRGYGGDSVPGSEKCKVKENEKFLEHWHDRAKTQLRMRVAYGTTGGRNGMEVFYYKSGKVASKSPYVCGVKHGVVRSWHENGQLFWEVPINQGWRDGLERKWHKSGQLYLEEPWVIVKERGVRKSIRHGTVKTWREDGSPMRETPYVKGKKHGEMKVYWPSGRLRRIHHYKNGKEGRVESFPDR